MKILKMIKLWIDEKKLALSVISLRKSFNLNYFVLTMKKMKIKKTI
jgi:hypothetical protein